jgi:hypothetical protein
LRVPLRSPLPSKDLLLMEVADSFAVCLFSASSLSFEMEAHTCNPNYSGGRDQEDCGSRPTRQKWKQTLISKLPTHKKSWWSGSSSRVPV